MKKCLLVACLVFFMAVLPALSAEGPVETVKKHVAAVVRVLDNPALDRQQKIDRIAAMSENMFDYTELSKRCLGAYWNRFSPDQRKRFERLFRKFLEKVYADRILAYQNEKIRYGNPLMYSATLAQVPTSVERADGPVSIDYRLIRENGTWYAYDVVVEGVSLVNNYREQFREILSNHSPDDLLQMLEKKVKAG